MRRLNGVDAYFLYSETPTASNHTLKIGIYEPTQRPDGYSFDAMKQLMAARLHLLPPFRWRVVPSPLGLHHPLFVEDPDFDLERHVFRIGVPAPGTLREMCEMVSQIASVPLDPRKPLWEVWILEGLEGGKVGFVAKAHHALADGVASAELLGHFFSAEPGAEVPRDDPPWRPEAIPPAWKRLALALRDLPRSAFVELPTTYRASRNARRKTAERLRAGEARPPSVSQMPKVPFNGRLTPHRAFACRSFALADVKTAGRAFGVTINDVVLAATSGALRRYLQKHGALPDAPLVASMPFSIRTEAERGTYGNRVTTNHVALRTDVEDPAERIRACHEAASVTKAHFQATRGAQIADWLEFSPPFVARAGALLVRLRKGRGSLAANVIVSNVPGPREPLYLDHDRLGAFYSIGQIMEGTGLNMTVWSYTGQLNLSVLACPELVPDVWRLVDDFDAALHELMDAASRHDAA